MHANTNCKCKERKNTFILDPMLFFNHRNTRKSYIFEHVEGDCWNCTSSLEHKQLNYDSARTWASLLYYKSSLRHGKYTIFVLLLLKKNPYSYTGANITWTNITAFICDMLHVIYAIFIITMLTINVSVRVYGDVNLVNMNLEYLTTQHGWGTVQFLVLCLDSRIW